MNAVVPLPVVVPLSAAAVVLFGTVLLPRPAVRAIALLAVSAEVICAADLLLRSGSTELVYWFGGWRPRHGVAMGISFTVDRIGAGAAVLAGLVTGAAVLTLPRTVRDADGIVHALVLTMLGAMAGFCLTGDLFNMFVFFELMAVSAFALAAYHIDRVASLRSALNFAVTNSIGAFLVLIAIALLYGRTGALNLAQIGRSLHSRPPDRLVLVALGLILVGFLIKAAVIPFHFWLVDTVTAAPFALAVVLAGVLDALGVYAVARVYWTVFAGAIAGDDHVLQLLLIGTGAVSAVTAAVLSVWFTEPRRRLAFVMVSHTGLVVIGIGCLTAQGVAASAIYAAADGMVKVALFLALLLSGSRIGRYLLVVGGLATAGLPLFATGLGKAAIDQAAGGVGYPWITAVAVVAAALTGAAVLDMARSHSRDGVARGSSILAGAATFFLVLAVAIGALSHGVGVAAAQFVDVAAYQHSVLVRAAVSKASGTTVALTAGGAVLDVLAVGAAVLTAALLPSARARRPPYAPRVWTAVRRLHDGSIGDAATWVTIGTAVFAAVLVVGGR